MSRRVDFRELRQSLGIEQVLTSYRVSLKRVGLHQLRGRCPLPTHASERSRESFSVDTAKNVWACHSASCCEARQGRVGGKRFGSGGVAGGVFDSAGRVAPAGGVGWSRNACGRATTRFKRKLREQRPSERPPRLPIHLKRLF